MGIDYLRKTRAIRAKSVVESLRQQVQALGAFVRMQYLLFYILAPICFFYTGAYSELVDSPDLLRTSIVAVTLLAVFGLVLWYGRKHISVLYAQHLRKLQAVLSGLEAAQ